MWRIYVNETRIAALAQPIAERYFTWAAARGVEGAVPPWAGWVEHHCADRDHASDLYDMLLDWGVPPTAMRIRQLAKEAAGGMTSARAVKPR